MYNLYQQNFKSLGIDINENNLVIAYLSNVYNQKSSTKMSDGKDNPIYHVFEENRVRLL